MTGIVLINYHNYKEVIDFIENECRKLREIKIAIVDNCESNYEFKILSKRYKTNDDIHVITKNLNLGYAKANNYGFNYLSKRYRLKYCLFSNTDIVICDSDVIDYLIAKLEQNPNIACVNPRITDENFKFNQTPYQYQKFYKGFIFKKLLYPFYFKRIKNGLWSDLVSNAKEGIYYRLSGAFLLVKTKDFIECGMFDENTFLFAEESILSERFHRINKSCGYFPDKKIIHRIHGTISLSNNSAQIALLMLKNNFYYQQKYRKIKKIDLYAAYFTWFLFHYVYSSVYKILKF